METKLNISMKDRDVLNLQMATPVAGTTNYERLKNLPQINGVTLLGNRTLADLHIVSENTADGWSEQPLYVPKPGEICIYTDSRQIKIGDGATPIVDLPYMGQSDYDAVIKELREHTANASIHVSQQDREHWNNKLNYEISDDELIFNRI